MVETATGRVRRTRLWRVALAVAVAVSVAAAFGLRGQLTQEALAAHHEALMAWRDANLARAVAVFFVSYVVAAAVAVPGVAALTVLGGFLFGAIPATLLVVVAATLGATGLFLLARAGLGDWVLTRWSARVPGESPVAALARALKENEVKALLLLRLTPVFPFFLCNIIPGILGARPRNFVLTTLFGIMPGTFLFALAGRGLGEVVASGGRPSLAVLAPFLMAIPALILAMVLARRLLRAARGANPPEG